jgi:hypothetical protein
VETGRPGKELINTKDKLVVVGGGVNSMPDEEWAVFKPRRNDYLYVNYSTGSTFYSS